MDQKTGFSCRTRRLGDMAYKGYVVVFDEGRRMYSLSARIVRLSRGDALQDARQLATELAIVRFDQAA